MSYKWTNTDFIAEIYPELDRVQGHHETSGMTFYTVKALAKNDQN